MPRKRIGGSSEKKRPRPWEKFISLNSKRKASPNSKIDRNELPMDVKKLYEDLSSSSESEISDHLDNLKRLLKGSNLEKQFSRPSSASKMKQDGALQN